MARSPLPANTRRRRCTFLRHLGRDEKSAVSVADERRRSKRCKFGEPKRSAACDVVFAKPAICRDRYSRVPAIDGVAIRWTIIVATNRYNGRMGSGGVLFLLNVPQDSCLRNPQQRIGFGSTSSVRQMSAAVPLVPQQQPTSCDEVNGREGPLGDIGIDLRPILSPNLGRVRNPVNPADHPLLRVPIALDQFTRRCLAHCVL